MSERICLLALLSLLGSAVWVGCKSDTGKKEIVVTGRWELFQGLRNGRVSETLQGTYFEFLDNGKMKTNLPVGLEETTDYSIKGNVLEQKGTKTLHYSIQQATDSTLTLAIELRGMPFELRLRKALPEPAATPDSLQTNRPDSLTR